ncbi:MAG: hydroxymethylglutaryl-CoA reductase, degradative [Candidatus Diapherotrites archaeon]
MQSEKTSELEKFYSKSLDERMKTVSEFAELSENEIAELKTCIQNTEKADKMSENVISSTFFPLSVATNFKINGNDYLVPMAIEEASVVAAASNAAKLCRTSGGFEAKASEQIMIGQVQIVNVKNTAQAKTKIMTNQKEILKLANAQDKTLVSFGGGAKKIDVKVFRKHKMIVVYLYVDAKDAMGANAVNTMAEAVAPKLEELSKGEARLRILSNLATERIVKAKAVWTKEILEKNSKNELSGPEIIERILDAHKFAELDVYRACTHNKGIMNGIDAVAIATGNDFRALEAGAHCYASLEGNYKPLTKFHKNKTGDLVGEIEIPLAVGIVGGATKTHPIAKIAMKILGIQSAKELGCVMACVGLAQNFSALRALANDGIQKGHMSLHARNIAIMAGATEQEADSVAERMINENNVKVDSAKEILMEIRR